MRKNLFFIALAATALFTACSNENDPIQSNEGEKVNFFVDNGPITRTTINTETGVTNFADQDEIGIYANGGATAQNVGYTLNTADQSLQATDPNQAIVWNDNKVETNFYAYYPFAAGKAADKVEFTAGNQGSEADFAKNDFLTAKQTIVANAQELTVKFQFKHALALIKVKLSGSEAAKATAVTITAKPTATWTLADGTFATSGTATTIQMWKIAADKQEYWAMVPAQTFEANQALIAIAAGADTYTYKPKTAITVSTSKSKVFNLVMGQQQGVVEIDPDLGADGWTPEGTEESGDTEVVVTPAIELISTDATFSATSIGKESIPENTWGITIGSNSAGIISQPNDAEKGNVFKFEFTALSNWYQNTLWYVGTNAPSKKFTLSFEAKANIASGQLITCVTGTPESGNLLFALTDASKQYAQRLATIKESDVWTKFEYEIDFSLCSTTANASEQTITAASTEANRARFYVVFSPNKGKEGTYEIANITLTEVK